MKRSEPILPGQPAYQIALRIDGDVGPACLNVRRVFERAHRDGTPGQFFPA